MKLALPMLTALASLIAACDAEDSTAAAAALRGSVQDRDEEEDGVSNGWDWRHGKRHGGCREWWCMQGCESDW